MAGLSVRQELFARKVASGVPPFRAYPEAGYKKQTGNPYRLMTQNNTVKARIDAILATGMKKADLTEDHVIALLSKEATTAKSDGARVRAAELMGQALAMFKAQSQTDDPDKVTRADLAAMLTLVNELKGKG